MNKTEEVTLLLDVIVDEINQIINSDVSEKLDASDVIKLAVDIVLKNSNTVSKSPLIAEIDRDDVMFDMGDEFKITINGEDYDEN